MNTSDIKSLTKEEAVAIQLLRQIKNDHEQQRLMWIMEGWIEEINIRRCWEENHERC